MGATEIGLTILLGTTGRPEAVLVMLLLVPEGWSKGLKLDSTVLGEVEWMDMLAVAAARMLSEAMCAVDIMRK